MPGSTSSSSTPAFDGAFYCAFFAVCAQADQRADGRAARLRA